MRKVFSILAALVVFSLSVTAQSTFKKSDILAEGTVSYVTKSSEATWSVAPSVGYMLTSKFAVGAMGTFGEIDSKNETVANFAVFGRCYFFDLGRNFKFYSQLNVGQNSSKDSSGRVTSFATSLGMGVNYFLSKNIALSANLCELASYNSRNSNLSLGFSGVNNPLSQATFGILVRL